MLKNQIVFYHPEQKTLIKILKLCLFHCKILIKYNDDDSYV